MIIDTARLGTARPAPGGGVIVPAHIGRSGVQVYRRPDGSTVRAYRPPEEVRVADYTGAPLTVGHPDGGMSPDRWRESVGVVRGQASETRRIGAHEFVRADLQVSEADAISKLGTDLVECSCAYGCEKIWEPGVTADGEQYDVTFRGLVPNHVALGPAGFARAGREARLIADGEDEMQDCLSDNLLIADDGGTSLPGPVPTPAPAPAGDRDQLVADAAVLKGENEALKRELETAKGSLAASEAKRAELQTQVDGLPKAIADGVTAELKFRQEIADRLPKDYSFDGKDSRQVKVDAIKHINSKIVIADDAKIEWLDAVLVGLAGAPTPEHDHNLTHGPAVQDGKDKTESVYSKKSREAFAVKGA